MKNILVYITILIIKMPSVKLSADITLRTNNQFATKAPAENNPFVGGTPKDIERNLFAPKPIKIQNKNSYNVDFNHNTTLQHKNVSYLNREVMLNTKGTNTSNITINTNNINNQIKRYNRPFNSNEGNVVVTYNMPTTINIDPKIGETFGNEENTTTQSSKNPYEGSGAPSTYTPIGDVVWPLLLLALAYIEIKRRIKN